MKKMNKKELIDANGGWVWGVTGGQNIYFIGYENGKFISGKAPIPGK